MAKHRGEGTSRWHSFAYSPDVPNGGHIVFLDGEERKRLAVRGHFRAYLRHEASM